MTLLLQLLSQVSITKHSLSVKFLPILYLRKFFFMFLWNKGTKELKIIRIIICLQFVALKRKENKSIMYFSMYYFNFLIFSSEVIINAKYHVGRRDVFGGMSSHGILKNDGFSETINPLYCDYFLTLFKPSFRSTNSFCFHT